MKQIEFNPAWAVEGHSCDICPESTRDAGIYLCAYHGNRKAAMGAEAASDDESRVLLHRVRVEVLGGDPEVRQKLQEALQRDLVDDFAEPSVMSERVNDIISNVMRGTEEKKEKKPPLNEIMEFLSSKDPEDFFRKKMLSSINLMNTTVASMGTVATIMNMDAELVKALDAASGAVKAIKEMLEKSRVDPENPAAPADH